MKKLFLIDGNAIIHRAYHALPHFTTSKGEIVNAVYGFSSMLLNIINNQKPDYIAVSFDRKAPTFRHEEYADYKATRVKAPDELYAQIPRIKQIVESFNIPIFEMDGFEADDILGTLAKQAEELCREGAAGAPTNANTSVADHLTDCSDDDRIATYIVTGDMDTLQLVSPTTFVFSPQKGFQDTIVYDHTRVLAKYGLEPSQIVDYKALKGDPSDNIPGVMGIGDKTAVALLQKYKTLENIYANIDGISGAVKDKLIKGKANAIFSKHLATIVTDVPVTLDVEKCKTHDFDLETIFHLFEELEFKSLLGKLSKFNSHYSKISSAESSGQTSLF